MEMKQVLFTDHNKFGIRAFRNISTFKNVDKKKANNMKRKHGYGHYANRFLGACSVTSKSVFLNLPMCRCVSDKYNIPVEQIISETILHESLHCIIEDVYPDATVTGSEKVIQNISDTFREVIKQNERN